MSAQTGAHVNYPRLYCLTCNRMYGSIPNGEERTRFFCPGNPTHCTTIIHTADGIRWLCFQSWMLHYEERYTPMAWWGHWSGFFAEAPGRYLSARFILILLALCLFPCCDCQIMECLSVIIALGVILDALLVTSSSVFVSRNYTVPFRSVVLSLFSFSHIVISFAVLYNLFPHHFSKPINCIRALYFSFVTITTLGYGDIEPCLGAWHLQCLVILELVVGLYFLVVLLSAITNWANSLPMGRPTTELPRP